MRNLALALSLALATASGYPANAGPAPDPAPDSNRYDDAEALGRYARGRLLEEQGHWDEALAEYFRAVALDPKALAPVRRASELSARQGGHGQSLEFAERALAIDPNDARSLWLKGAALFNLGKPGDALGILTAAAERDPERVEYWKTLIRVAELQRDLELLARASRATVSLDDSDVEAWFQLAGAEARLGRFGAADSALRVARAGNPSRPGTEFLGAWIDEGLARDDQAIDGYLRHLRVHGDDLATRQRVVGLLASRERWGEALKHARMVTDARPRDPEALETEADIAFKGGQPAIAQDRLERLQRVDPSDPQFAGRAILVLARNQRGNDGLKVATAWSSGHPGDFRGVLLEARAHALAGQVDRAIEKTREAIRQVPDSLGPQLLLGRIAQTEKRWALAAETWSSVLKMRPREVSTALDLAYCREQMGDIEGAVAAARDALAWAPDRATTLNFLGYLLADHARDLTQAVDLIRQAVNLDPDNGAYIDSLGWVYYRLGRLAEARNQLERAALLTRGDPVVLEHLGDVYRDLRLLDKARDQYRKSLASDRSNQRVRNKLEALR